jgi:hypothetical protein
MKEKSMKFHYLEIFIHPFFSASGNLTTLKEIIDELFEPFSPPGQCFDFDKYSIGQKSVAFNPETQYFWCQYSPTNIFFSSSTAHKFMPAVLAGRGKVKA